jgi:hypothetical protein
VSPAFLSASGFGGEPVTLVAELDIHSISGWGAVPEGNSEACGERRAGGRRAFELAVPKDFCLMRSRSSRDNDRGDVLKL